MADYCASISKLFVSIIFYRLTFWLARTRVFIFLADNELFELFTRTQMQLR